MIASISAALFASSHLWGALVGLGLWGLCSAFAGISGIAAVQDLVPNEYRGVGMALVAFCNTLLGLGFGPTLVALATDLLYRDPSSVGLSLTTTVVPAGFLASLFFFAAIRSGLRGNSTAHRRNRQPRSSRTALGRIKPR